MRTGQKLYYLNLQIGPNSTRLSKAQDPVVPREAQSWNKASPGISPEHFDMESD